MKKNSLIILGVSIAIVLSMYSLYIQKGSEFSSNLSSFVNPCLSLYDQFKDELMSKGFFDSESTKEQNRAFQKFISDNCHLTYDSWLPSDRQNEKDFLEQLRQRMTP